MDNPLANNEERLDEVPAYEPPTVVDHGSLAELTLGSTGGITDGVGPGGFGS
jgi:hypothetical protein